MKTIALRFGENLAPPCGTIEAHKKYIRKYGVVWYGKFGAPLSDKVIKQVLENKEPRILLIHSGSSNRYWAYVDKIEKDVPELSKVPSYYHGEIERIKTWFRVYRFESADKYVMSKCTVLSSGASLSNASRHSMSPYFIIEYESGIN